MPSWDSRPFLISGQETLTDNDIATLMFKFMWGFLKKYFLIFILYNRSFFFFLFPHWWRSCSGFYGRCSGCVSSLALSQAVVLAGEKTEGAEIRCLCVLASNLLLDSVLECLKQRGTVYPQTSQNWQEKKKRLASIAWKKIKRAREREIIITKNKLWNIIITVSHVACNNNLTFYLVCYKSIIYTENKACVFERGGQRKQERSEQLRVIRWGLRTAGDSK